MRKLIIENQYFPSILFYSLCLRFETVELEACENFQKKSFRNRMQLPGPNGVQTLSIPLESGKTKKSVKDVKISYAEDWMSNHWSTIQNIYRHSPYFIHYKDQLRELYSCKYDTLFEFQMAIHNFILDALKVNCNWNFTEQYFKDYDEELFVDARDVISPKGIGIEGFEHKRYQQVFEDKIGFIPNMSVLDLIFCEGPNSVTIL